MLYLHKLLKSNGALVRVVKKFRVCHQIPEFCPVQNQRLSAFVHNVIMKYVGIVVRCYDKDYGTPCILVAKHNN